VGGWVGGGSAGAVAEGAAKRSMEGTRQPRPRKAPTCHCRLHLVLAPVLADLQTGGMGEGANEKLTAYLQHRNHASTTEPHLRCDPPAPSAHSRRHLTAGCAYTSLVDPPRLPPHPFPYSPTPMDSTSRVTPAGPKRLRAQAIGISPAPPLQQWRRLQLRRKRASGVIVGCLRVSRVATGARAGVHRA
jgi:hypothetical protein